MNAALSFLEAVAGQLIGMIILPRSLGFTNLIPTIACLLRIDFGVWMLARLAQQGVGLGVLVPLNAAVLPLASSPYCDRRPSVSKDLGRRKPTPRQRSVVRGEYGSL